MKLNAIFELEKLYEAVAVSEGFQPFDDETDHIKEMLQDSMFKPEGYKEVSVLNIPVVVEDLNEESEHLDEVVRMLNSFAEKNNIKRILLTNSIDELSEM